MILDRILMWFDSDELGITFTSRFLCGVLSSLSSLNNEISLPPPKIDVRKYYEVSTLLVPKSTIWTFGTILPFLYVWLLCLYMETIASLPSASYFDNHGEDSDSKQCKCDVVSGIISASSVIYSLLFNVNSDTDGILEQRPNAEILHSSSYVDFLV